MATECAICFEDMTVATGHSVLGCGHTFHLRCIVAWFQEQECASSCPCCRCVVGELDNVPLYPDDGEEPESDSESDDGSEEDSLLDSESEDEDELVSGIETANWSRAASGRWHLDGMRYVSWGIEDGTPVPRSLVSSMKEAATKVQALWRGHLIRRPIIGE
jgi:hypothetical protein